MWILGVSSLSSYKTLKQQLNGEKNEKWDGEQIHLSFLCRSMSSAWKKSFAVALCLVLCNA